MAEVPAVAAEPVASAYDLLTRDTLTLTDAEVAAIVVDLRKRRLAYVTQGKKDAPKAKPAAALKTPSEQKQLTQDLLASLDLDLGLGDMI
jgi:hypothetical protein